MTIQFVACAPTLWLFLGAQFIEVIYGRRRRPSQSLVAGFTDGNGTTGLMTRERYTALNTASTVDLTTAPAMMLHQTHTDIHRQTQTHRQRDCQSIYY